MTLTRAAAPPGGRPAMPTPVSPLGRLGSWSYRHRRMVAAVWLLILVLVSVAGRAAGSRFKDDLNTGTATQSQQAAAFLQARFPRPGR
jgi:RND superfamily putative drug exporter